MFRKTHPQQHVHQPTRYEQAIDKLIELTRSGELQWKALFMPRRYDGHWLYHTGAAWEASWQGVHVRALAKNKGDDVCDVVFHSEGNGGAFALYQCTPLMDAIRAQSAALEECVLDILAPRVVEARSLEAG